MPQYLRKYLFEEEHTNLKLMCDFCNHITHKHLPSWHISQKHHVVKCWLCGRTVWFVTILQKRE